MSFVRRFTTIAAFAAIGIGAVVVQARDGREAAASAASGSVHRLYPEIADLSLATYARISTDFARLRVESIAQIQRAGAWPCTAYRCAVLDSVRGETPETIDVFIAGGFDGVATVVVHGAPALEIGREYAAFLFRDPTTSQWGINGLTEGLYHLDAAGDDAVIHGKHAVASESYSSFVARVRGESVHGR